jgi:hypothetical protein
LELSGSISRRFSSRERAQFFFKEIEFDFELTDLLVELTLQFFGGFLFVLSPVGDRKKSGGLFVQLAFPFGDQVGMDLKFAGYFVGSFTAAQGFKGGLWP